MTCSLLLEEIIGITNYPMLILQVELTQQLTQVEDILAVKQQQPPTDSSEYLLMLTSGQTSRTEQSYDLLVLMVILRTVKFSLNLTEVLPQETYLSCFLALVIQTVFTSLMLSYVSGTTIWVDL